MIIGFELHNNIGYIKVYYGNQINAIYYSIFSGTTSKISADEIVTITRITKVASIS